MKLQRTLFDYRNPRSAVNRFRKARSLHWKRCLGSLESDAPIRIADVGGTYGYWKGIGLLDPERYKVVLFNLRPTHLPPGAIGFEERVADANSDEISFADFDVVFANSVIEHLGSRAAMESFAQKASCARAHYIQTPGKWFPLEPHCRLPFFQFLPRVVRAWLVWTFDINYFPRAETLRGCLKVSDSTILLSKRQLRRMFPKSEIFVERLLGLPKSYTAYGGFE